MLITHKLTSDKRPVVDFRLLNTRILSRNTSIPLMSDVLNILDNSDVEIISCVDICDAYHSIPLSDRSKGVFVAYYLILVAPFTGMKFSPWALLVPPKYGWTYISLILGELEQKHKYIAIMDDLLIHSSKKDHWILLEQLFISMCRNKLHLSPKKCQLFKNPPNIYG